MQVKKIFTYTIDELPMEVQNKVFETYQNGRV